MGEKEFLRLIDPEGTARVRCRFVTVRGRLESVVVQLEVLADGRWQAVVRYDNAHGYAHRDEFDSSGRETKTALALPNLEMVVAYAEQDMRDRWQWYRDRFLARPHRRTR